jgi:hypothetical protein
MATPRLTDPVKKSATRSDSLAVYNNAVKVDKFYGDKVKSGQYIEGESDRYMEIDHEQLVAAHKYNDSSAREIENRHEVKTAFTSVIRNGKEVDENIEPRLYRQDIDANRYMQRETANGVLNMDSPMQLFDRRITPTGIGNYRDPTTTDLVSIFKYDPLAVKPWDLLDESQKKERISKYGYSGTPFSADKKAELQESRIQRESLSQMEPRITDGDAYDNTPNVRFQPNDVTVTKVDQPNYKFQGGFVDEKVASDSTIRSEANRQVADDELLTKQQIASKYGLYKGIKPTKMSQITF